MVFCKLFISLSRRFSSKSAQSSLLISGRRAEDTFVVVIPHLDFDKRFENFYELEENIKRRKLDCNLTEMKDVWYFYKDWNGKKLTLQENLTIAGKQISQLLKTEESEKKKSELENLDRYKNLLKEDLLQVKKNVWDMEDSVISQLLKIPNVLHPKAPSIEKELFVFDKETFTDGFNHLQMGFKLDCLEYINKLTYFLKNEAALFELAATDFFIDSFSNNGFVKFSNPDFARNVLAEGVGVAPDDSSELFLLEDTESKNDNLHLCGGASLFPFCGYHAKHSVPKRGLPVRYVAAGRRYSPTTGAMPGLYSVNQSTAVQFFVGTSNEEELYNEFQSCVKLFSDVFGALGLNFRVVSQSPDCFKSWESLRASVQVFSPYEKRFLEVGNVTLIGDYVSKRLKMCYADKKGELFLQVLSGCVVDTQTLLALCLERSQGSLFIPDVLKDFMISSSK